MAQPLPQQGRGCCGGQYHTPSCKPRLIKSVQVRSQKKSVPVCASPMPQKSVPVRETPWPAAKSVAVRASPMPQKSVSVRKTPWPAKKSVSVRKTPWPAGKVRFRPCKSDASKTSVAVCTSRCFNHICFIFLEKSEFVRTFAP